MKRGDPTSVRTNTAVQAKVLQQPNQCDGQRVETEQENGVQVLLGRLEGKEDDAGLHEEDGDGLRGEEPLELPPEDDDEEDAETHGVVHDGASLERAHRDGGGADGLALRVGVGGEHLAGVADERREDEGDVEAVDVHALCQVVQKVHDGVGEEDHDRGAGEHHREAAEDDAALLLLGGQVHQVRGHLLLLVAAVVAPRLDGEQLALGAAVHDVHDEVAELVEAQFVVLVAVELLQQQLYLRLLHRLAQVRQQHLQLLHADGATAVHVVAVEEGAHQDAHVLHQLGGLREERRRHAVAHRLAVGLRNTGGAESTSISEEITAEIVTSPLRMDFLISSSIFSWDTYA